MISIKKSFAIQTSNWNVKFLISNSLHNFFNCNCLQIIGPLCEVESLIFDHHIRSIRYWNWIVWLDKQFFSSFWKLLFFSNKKTKTNTNIFAGPKRSSQPRLLSYDEVILSHAPRSTPSKTASNTTTEERGRKRSKSPSRSTKQASPARSSKTVSVKEKREKKRKRMNLFAYFCFYFCVSVNWAFLLHHHHHQNAANLAQSHQHAQNHQHVQNHHLVQNHQLVW